MATINYTVNAINNASAVFAKIGLSADGLDKQLSDLSKRVANPEVDLNDAKFQLGVINSAKRLDKLNEMIAKPDVEVPAAKVQTEILRINAMLDRLNSKRVEIPVEIDMAKTSLDTLKAVQNASNLRQEVERFMFEGSGGAAGTLPGGSRSGLFSRFGAGFAAAGGSGFGGFFKNVAGGLGGLPLPAAIPLGATGAAVGGGVAAASAGYLASLVEALTPTVTGVGTALGGVLLGAMFNKKFAAGLSGIQAEIKNILSVVVMPVVQGFTKLMPSIDLALENLGPPLKNLFAASVPYLKMFVGFLEQAAKTLLPVFAQSLKQMQPFLPVIGKGLLAIVQGFAGFIAALGPRGMKVGAEAFLISAKVIGGLIDGLGKAINFLAVEFGIEAHAIAKSWDWLRQQAVAIVKAMISGWDMFRHDTAVIFDGLRHDLAAIWDAIWNNTVGRVRSGISQIVSFFNGLPGKVLGALRGLGTSLYNFMHSAFTDMWDAAKHVASDIWNWLTGWTRDLPGWLKSLLGIKSPSSVFYDIGWNMMKGLEKGIQHAAVHAADAARHELAHIADNVGSFFGKIGAMGIGVSSPTGGVAGLARAMAAQRGWTGTQWDALNAVEMREAGWNLNARNPSSGAYGIAQFINGPSEYYSYGGNPNTAQGQITAWLNYVAQRYGNPVSAWAHEQRFGWYDKGGWLMPGTTIATNNTGRPERIVSPNEGMTISLVVKTGPGANALDQAIVEIIKKHARLAGGGDLQAAFGTY